MPHFIYETGIQLYIPESVDNTSHLPFLANEDGTLFKYENDASLLSNALRAHNMAHFASSANSIVVFEVEDDLGPPCNHISLPNKYNNGEPMKE